MPCYTTRTVNPRAGWVARLGSRPCRRTFREPAAGCVRTETAKPDSEAAQSGLRGEKYSFEDRFRAHCKIVGNQSTKCVLNQGVTIIVKNCNVTV